MVVDPDAKLLAVIKTRRKSFAAQDRIALPSEPVRYVFRSSKTNGFMEFHVEPGDALLKLTRREGQDEWTLRVTEELEPREFAENGKTIAAVDVRGGKIKFAEEEYDLAEPVYPMEFVVMLYALLDWSKTEQESLLYLAPGRKRCRLSVAKRTEISGHESKVIVDTGDGSVQLHLRDGKLVKYIEDDEETFTLVSATPQADGDTKRP